MPPPGSYDHCAFGFNAQKTILPGGVMTPPYNLLFMYGNQEGTKVFLFLQEFCQAFAVGVGAGGIFVGIVAGEAAFCVVKGDKMGAQAAAFVPAVEEDGGIGGFGFFVVFFWIGADLHGKAHFLQADGGGPEAGARIAVDQGQLPFVIAD